MSLSNPDSNSFPLALRVAQVTSEIYRLAYAQVSPELVIVQASENLSAAATEPGGDVIGIHLTDAFSELVGTENVLQSILLGQKDSYQIDFINRLQPDGSVRYLTFRVLPFDTQQTDEGLLFIAEDMTQYGQIERNLLHSRNELQLARNILAQSNTELDIRVRERTKELETAKEQIEKQLERIKSLHSIDLAILSVTDLGLTLKIMLKEASAHLHVDMALFMLFDQHSLALELAASMGLQNTQTIRRKLGEGLLGKVALERKIVGYNSIDPADLHKFSKFAQQEKIMAFYGVPLVAKGDLVGVLGVGNRTPLNPDQEWLDFLEVLSAQSALAIDNSRAFERLQRSNYELALAYDTTIEGWSRALDLRDRETHGHTQRVTNMTLKLAYTAGIAKAELVHVKRGAYLHDIGKMGIPDAILLKPEKLTSVEWDIMRKHPIYAYEMLSPIEYLHPAIDIPYCHHEKWDGTGYPRKLGGEQIPLAARLFAVVDVWDALRSDRPYRKGWSQNKVLEYIQEQSGTHFDPRAVELFIRLIQDTNPDSQISE